MVTTSKLNWSETVTYTSARLDSPTSVAEVQELVASSDRVKAIGSRHSFNDAADTDGVQVSVAALPPTMVVDQAGETPRTVTCASGLTHAQVSEHLHGVGAALANLASLPHISVGGAIQTGTHGSGLGNAALSASVSAVELVDAQGELRRLTRNDPDFNAVVVGLGAFGVVTSVTHDVVDAFDVEQHVFERAPWDAVLTQLPEVMGSGYSVSLFARFDSDHVDQVWVKQRSDARTDVARDLLEAAGATAATRELHPLPDTPADNVTPQLGARGASHLRLPHFRHDFKPGRGDEIQTEYLLDIDNGVAAIEAVRRLGHLVAPILHIAEVRAVAADDAWLSPSAGRDSLAIHFTWQNLPDQVAAVVPRLEEVLLPLGARPHWGKVFACGHEDLRKAYPRLDDFAGLVAAYDPTGKFENAYLRRALGRSSRTA